MIGIDLIKGMLDQGNINIIHVGVGDVKKKHRCLDNRLFYIGKVEIYQATKL